MEGRRRIEKRYRPLPETSRLASSIGPIIKSADKVIGRHCFEAAPVLRFDELDCEGRRHELTMRSMQVSTAKQCGLGDVAHYYVAKR
jgi:hypothetical protein